MVYYGLLWFTMVYYGSLWFTMAYYGLLWLTMVYYGLLLPPVGKLITLPDYGSYYMRAYAFLRPI